MNIQQLREKEPRKFDALVAEKVHGMDLGYDGFFAPNYHLRADDDLISHRVMCAAKMDIEYLYWIKLGRIWGFDHKPSLSAMRNYKIGDYSQAALEALEPSTEKEV